MPVQRGSQVIGWHGRPVGPRPRGAFGLFFHVQFCIAKLAEEFDVQPSQIHLWVKQVLEGAERAFERSPGRRKNEGAKDRRIEQLEATLVQTNEVISELMEENVRAKKATGEL